jgi:flagellin
MLSATTNTAALTAQRYVNSSSSAASSSIAKMSSGNRIVKASDDASSLAIGNKLRADIAALQQSSRNAGQGASLLQVANGSMDRINDILIRMKTLSTQVVNGTLSITERQYAQQEFSQLVNQVDQISTQTRWNGVSFLNGGNKTVGSTNTLPTNRAAGVTGLDATATNFFSNASIGTFAGEISGSVTDVNVTNIGGQQQIDVVIGSQTFRGVVSVGSNNANGSAIVLRSLVNDHNSFTMTINQANNIAAGIAGATALQTDIEDLFELDNAAAAPASFLSGALTDANAGALINGGTASALSAVVRANGATADGTYTVTSAYDLTTDKATIRIQDAKGNVYNQTIENPAQYGLAGAPANLTIGFSNGVEITLAAAKVAGLTTATNNFGTSTAQSVRFDVNQGTATTMDFQVGEKSTDLIQINFSSMTSAGLGLNVLNIETFTGGQTASDVISDAISRVNNSQAELGAIQSRMEYVQNNLATVIENLSAAKGIFLDVDMAAEMTEFTKQNTLTQAGVSMLAQANQLPQQLLQLIRQ